MMLEDERIAYRFLVVMVIRELDRVANGTAEASARYMLWWCSQHDGSYCE